jgi:serine/threonine-protein kinase
MPLAANQVLLHYRLVGKLGQGGMGEVWKAVDTDLNREVAIKVLPDAFSQSPERLARFEREARLLASLNHPNIASIYGLHDTGPSTTSGQRVRFLAMELVPGDDLAQRLERGPLSTDEAQRIALQIAEALETAHGQGVIHRDLKPANIKLTADGQVKVLDFGLAKAVDPGADGSGADPSLSPTMTSAGSLAGMILGTAAYMSPEQARGHVVDQRADIFAFGCVLYEMLTGRRLFSGKTVSDTLAEVLKTEPDWDALPDDTPPAVRRLLRRCLTKEPEERLHHAADARIELREATEGVAAEDAVAPAAAVDAQPAWRRALPWALVAALALVALIAVGFSELFVDEPTRETFNLAIPLPDDTRPFEDQMGTLTLSPDGRMLAIVLVRDGLQSLYLRKLDSPDVTPLAGTDDATTPFFSPDGQWVGFLAENKLKKISVSGGTPLTLCEAGGADRGATWTDDDRIVFAPNFTEGLSQVPGAGGTPAPLTSLDEAGNERTHRWPHSLPGGRAVLFTVGLNDSPEYYDDSRIDAVFPTTGERKTVMQGASSAFYAVTGHLVFARGGFLFAAPFDLDRVEVTGTPVPVAEGVMGNRASGVVHAAFSHSGTLAYIPGEQLSVRRVLAWRDRDGAVERLAAPFRAYSGPRVSPDGSRVAVAVGGATNNDVWVYDIARETLTRLTFEGDNGLPVWSPDGKKLAFFSNRGGTQGIYWKPADGSGGAQLVVHDEGHQYSPNDWSPDGRYIIIDDVNRASDIGYIDFERAVAGEPEVQSFLATEYDEYMANLSPDGRWITYVSDETGRYEVYVRPFPGPGGKWQLSVDGGFEPYWSPDGRAVLFRRNEQVLSAEIDTSEGFRPGRPKVVLDNLPRFQTVQAYTIDPRRGRFLFSEPAEGDDAPDRVVVIVNWFDELLRRVQ